MRCAERASVRIVLLMLVSFFLGLAVAAFWFHRPVSGNAANAVSQSSVPPPVAQPMGQPAAPPPPPTASPQPQNPAVIQEVKKLVPNYASISLSDGENILRAAALEQMDAQIKAAQQQLQDAQSSQSTADQLEKLKDMAARLQAQITALKSLKNQQ